MNETSFIEIRLIALDRAMELSKRATDTHNENEVIEVAKKLEAYLKGDEV